MNRFKKSVALSVSVLMLSSVLAGCGTTNTDEPAATAVATAEMPKEITFWHFNKDEGPKIEAAFKKKYPNVNIVTTITPQDNQAYQTKVTTAIQANNLPDILSAESAYVNRYVNMPKLFADITAESKSVTTDMVPYTVDVGTDSTGKVRALSHQATPGGIGYKRAAATQYLGTEDPEQIGAMLSTKDKILETAQKVSDNSKGAVKLFAGFGELMKIYLGGRATGWVKDNKLVIDPKVDEYLDLQKALVDKKLDGGFEQWQPAWASSIKDKGQAICYAIPTWGIPWIIGSNDETAKTSGSWAIAKSPFPYFWGGTWFGVSENSKYKTVAAEMVKFFTSDKEQLKAWAKDTGDFANQKALIDEGAASTAAADMSPILKQNVYAVFKPSLSTINGKILTQYDDVIEKDFTDILKTFLAGKDIKTKDDFMKKFKEKVKQDLPALAQ